MKYLSTLYKLQGNYKVLCIYNPTEYSNQVSKHSTQVLLLKQTLIKSHYEINTTSASRIPVQYMDDNTHSFFKSLKIEREKISK